MDDARLKAVMAYCRIGEDELSAEDEVLLESMYEDAIAYMEGAGVAEPATDTRRRAQYELCVNAMVLDAWDHRPGTLVEQGVTVTDNPSFRRRLNQLKLSEPSITL